MTYKLMPYKGSHFMYALLATYLIMEENEIVVILSSKLAEHIKKKTQSVVHVQQNELGLVQPSVKLTVQTQQNLNADTVVQLPFGFVLAQLIFVSLATRELVAANLRIAMDLESALSVQITLLTGMNMLSDVVFAGIMHNQISKQ